MQAIEKCKQINKHHFWLKLIRVHPSITDRHWQWQQHENAWTHTIRFFDGWQQGKNGSRERKDHRTTWEPLQLERIQCENRQVEDQCTQEEASWTKEAIRTDVIIISFQREPAGTHSWSDGIVLWVITYQIESMKSKWCPTTDAADPVVLFCVYYLHCSRISGYGSKILSASSSFFSALLQQLSLAWYVTLLFCISLLVILLDGLLRFFIVYRISISNL